MLSVDFLMMYLSEYYFRSMTGVFVLEAAVALAASTFFLLWFKRRQTREMLETCGLPTVQWKPRFVAYGASDEAISTADNKRNKDLGHYFQKVEKLPSTNITNVLPRMERLNGPFGMYGTVYGVSIPVVNVAHPVPARAILSATAPPSLSKSCGNRRLSNATQLSNGASKQPAYNHFKNFCGDGVFTADGDDWKAKRASIMHCLVKGLSTLEGLERLETEANRAADAFIAQVEELNHQDRSTHEAINVVPLLQRSTIGLIYRYITHHEPDWGLDTSGSSLEDSSVSSDEDDVSNASPSYNNKSKETLVKSQETASKSNSEEPTTIHRSTTKYLTTSLLETYLESVTRIRMIIQAQSRSIWFFLPRWCYRYFSSMYHYEEFTVAPIREFAKLACQNAAPGSPLDLLKQRESHNKEAKLSSQSHPWIRNSSEVSRKDGFSKDLFDEAITLLFAGQDTSAATLSWTLHLLSLYPKVQEKLANEIRTVLKDEALLDCNNPMISKKTFSRMPFLDAVIKESMRYYPVAPFVVRKLLHEVSIVDLDDDTNKEPITLPAGTFACIWIFGLHRNPKFWNRPNDFLPERWLDPALKDLGQTSGAYLPFASGPRNCVGQPLAHIVLRTLLARLVHRFEFRDDRLDDGLDASMLLKDMQAGFTVLPLGGLTLTIRKRRYETR